MNTNAKKSTPNGATSLSLESEILLQSNSDRMNILTVKHNKI